MTRLIFADTTDNVDMDANDTVQFTIHITSPKIYKYKIQFSIPQHLEYQMTQCPPKRCWQIFGYICGCACSREYEIAHVHMSTL